MRRPINPNIAPVGGWRFVDPDTDFSFSKKYNNLDELIGEVVKYRANNRLAPIGNLKELILNHICEQEGMGSYCCEVRTKKRSLKQYARGAYSYMKAHQLGADAFVSEELAEARADVCLNCPLMKIPKKTSELERITNGEMERLVGNKKVPQYKDLYTCDVCSCLVRAKVWFTRGVVDESLSNAERENLPRGAFGKDGKKFTCWQLVEPKIKTEVKYKVNKQKPNQQDERIKKIKKARE